MAGRRKRRLSKAERKKRKRETYRRWRTAHKEEINERKRRKWANDPQYRKKANIRRRRERLKQAYGLSMYNSILAQQRGRCAICHEKFKRTPCVDHCHE